MDALTAALRHFESKEPNKGILIFDRTSGNLQCFNPVANTWKQMQKMHDEMTKYRFSAVSLDDHIYVLNEDESVYRLKYSDEAATWERMADMTEQHGRFPPVTVVAGQIYVIGSDGVLTEAAEKYDPATNQWTRIKDRPQPSQFSQLLGTRGNIYCFDGFVDGECVNTVQRFDLSSSSWTDVKPMKESKNAAAAVELDGRVYVGGGWTGNGSCLKSFERYDPDINEWTSLSPMKVARFWFRAFAIEGFIYAVGGLRSSGSIEKYDIVKNEWEMVERPSGMKLEIAGSVNIKLE